MYDSAFQRAVCLRDEVMHNTSFLLLLSLRKYINKTVMVYGRGLVLKNTLPMNGISFHLRKTRPDSRKMSFGYIFFIFKDKL